MKVTLCNFVSKLKQISISNVMVVISRGIPGHIFQWKTRSIQYYFRNSTFCFVYKVLDVYSDVKIHT